MKRITCKPIEEIELCIEGGDSVLLRFDIAAVMKLQEMDEGGLGELLKKPMPELAACLIYAGAQTQGFELETARKMVACMSINDINAIIEEFSGTMNASQTEAQKELSKNLMAQFLATLK